MTPASDPFLTGRARPIATVLARIDLDRFDVVLLTLESVAADLGYGDIRPLPGSVAWIDALDVPPPRGVAVDVAPSGLAAARDAGLHLAIAVARGAGAAAARGRRCRRRRPAGAARPDLSCRIAPERPA